MKTLTNIVLIAAFIFGVQPQEAFSANDNTVEMAAAENGEARIAYDDRNDVITLGLKTEGGQERAQVHVLQHATGKTVIKEVFLVSNRAQSFEIDMSGMESGAYSVKVVAPSFREAARFKKK